MVLTTTQSIERQATADTTTISFSFQNLEYNLQIWQRAVDFLKKEHLFLHELLELSILSARGYKREELTVFQQKMMDFVQTDVTQFTDCLQVQMKDLIINNEARTVELETSNENMGNRWQEIDSVFKGLKLAAFEKISDNVPVKIY